MGPMALGDLVGLELFWKQRKACGSAPATLMLWICCSIYCRMSGTIPDHQAAGDMKKQTKTYYGPYELTDTGGVT